MTEYAKTVGEPNTPRGLLKMMKALGLSWSVGRISQHALVSLLLALQVLVTGCLPGAMFTEVSMHVRCTCVFPSQMIGHPMPLVLNHRITELLIAPD